MNYKLKDVDGKVTFLLRSGRDFVKNRMSITSAQHIVDHGKVKKSDKIGYPINVDNRWYFEGEVVKKVTVRENDEDEK